MLVIDFEVFRYDWLCVAIDPVKQKEYVIVNNTNRLNQLYHEYKKDIWVGYNLRAYDSYILKAILLGFYPKEVNDWIIVKGKKGWEFSSLFNTIPLNIYDVMPNIPVSLKVLEGFLGKNIHETSVPFDIDRKLTANELKETINYCRDDVLNTLEVFMKRKNEFDSQFGLIKTFNLSLAYLGKTQAQLAAIILGARKQRFKDEWEIKLPDNLQLGKYQYIGDWFLNKENHDYDAKLKTDIAGVPHVVALGGLHGALSKYQYECENDDLLVMADVDQLYPTIMVQYNLLSRTVAEPERFEKILTTSLELKAQGKKKEREPYKRICNITYGAEGDKFNSMYDPLHRNLVCVFGQVLMIDLIDKVEHLCELVQSNTDGILVKIKRSKLNEFRSEVEKWQDRTHLHMSFDEFVKIYQKDVNNYVIVPEGKLYDEAGKPRWKAKGAYVKELNDLDYDLPIVNEALKNYLLKKIAVEDTINSCQDIRKFQKLVKLSNKYKWVEHETNEGKEKFDNKCYRVFASNNSSDGKILKCDGVRNPAKFGNTPDHCFIYNYDVREAKVSGFQKLDKQYYIDLAKDRLIQFGVII